MKERREVAQTRSQVPVAGQVNYWLRVMLFIGLGLAYILGGPQRYATNPSYGIIQQIMPIDGWGLLFLAFGVALAVSWWISFRVARMALVTAGYIFMLWTAIYIVQAIAEPRASVAVVALFGFISATSFGSTLYLVVPGERK